MADWLAAEDRHLLEVIAQAHGHGPRRLLALLDIAWAETGSESAGRCALQRLMLLGLVDLGRDRPTKELLGKMSDKGANLLATPQAASPLRSQR